MSKYVVLVSNEVNLISIPNVLVETTINSKTPTILESEFQKIILEEQQKLISKDLRLHYYQLFLKIKINIHFISW